MKEAEGGGGTITVDKELNVNWEALVTEIPGGSQPELGGQSQRPQEGASGISGGSEGTRGQDRVLGSRGL